MAVKLGAQKTVAVANIELLALNCVIARNHIVKIHTTRLNTMRLMMEKTSCSCIFYDHLRVNTMLCNIPVSVPILCFYVAI